MKPMTPALLDTNVPIYATGRPHPLREPCIEILSFVAEHPDAFVTSAEVLQELLYRFLALRRWPQGREVLRGFADLMRERVEPVLAVDVERAAQLADSRPELSSRDLVHAALVQRLGLRYVVSADRDFDRLSGFERLDPASFGTWKDIVLR